MGQRLLLLAALVGLAGPVAALAQMPPGSRRGAYSRIPIPGGHEEALRTRLTHARQMDEFFKLLLKNEVPVSALQGLSLDKLDLNDKQLKKMATDMANQSGMSPEKLQTLKKDLTESIAKLKSAAANAPEESPLPATRIDGPPQPAADRPEDFDLRFNRWAMNLLRKAEHSRVGTMIQGSPAWRNAVKDLGEFMRRGGKTGRGWGLSQLGGMSFPKNLDFSFAQSTWNKLRGFDLPALPSVSLPLPSLDFGRSLPRLPRAPSSTFGPGILWLGIGLCLILLAWRLRRRAARQAQAAAGWQLGPWPVHPGRIASAAELRAAFEYLSFLRLGLRAATLNHRAVAGALAETGAGGVSRRAAADELAFFYEQARYAPGAASLSPETLASARRALCLLAGVALP